MRAFTKYVPHDVVKLMLSGQLPSEHSMVYRKLTILFTDIVGFSSVAEKLSPDRLVQVLTEYLQEMCHSIVISGGILDKVPFFFF